MRIAVLGGTGNLGKGLAMRLAVAGYDVIVGSRDMEKAKRVAEEYSREANREIFPAVNERAALECDLAIVTIPWKHAFSTLKNLRGALSGKTVVSPLVPMRKVGGVYKYLRMPEGSAAEKVSKLLPDSSVISAFHLIPAQRFANLAEKFDWDVPVCGDDEEAKRVVLDVVNSINGLRGLDAGPLEFSSVLEQLVPLILNVSRNSGEKDLGIKFV